MRARERSPFASGQLRAVLLPRLQPGLRTFVRSRSAWANFARINWLVVVIVVALAGLGVASLYSVAGGSFEPWAERHALRFVLALIAALTIAVLPLRLWLHLAYPAYGAAFVLLALVPFIGIETLGAKRWLGLGSFAFQPSEMMKVALILALARYYEWLPPEKVSRPQFLILPILMIAVPVALTLKQPDLGTAILLASLGFGLMFLSGVSVWYFAGGAASLLALGPSILSRLHPYQRKRLDIFMDPEQDPLGAGYHILQSKIALGAGGLQGRGFMQGTQSKLNFLPEKSTDFAFTMFAEEWGFVGSLGLIALYAALVALCIGMAMACRSRFAKLLASGAALIIFAYSFINIAMACGVVPVVGLPLPLISYGGTSMTASMIAIGLALCAFVHRDERFHPDEVGWVI